ncbi:MAG: TIGR03067 domain-containing protein [Gemmataceae bacterium]
MTKALLAMALVFGVAGIAGADDADKGFQKLAGTWQVVSQTEQGVAKRADEIKGSTLVIDATGKWQALQDGVVAVKGAGKLDPSKSPKTADWTFDGSDQVALAIYEVDGDTFKHCFSLTKRPTQFASKAGSTDIYMVLKRVKK